MNVFFTIVLRGRRSPLQNNSIKSIKNWLTYEQRIEGIRAVGTVFKQD